ncbi:MAG: hypothetical protein KAG66_13090, partial [Methylococcales bacterium]|nr:hypothetical protein [Methylococcales bacterium]
SGNVSKDTDHDGTGDENLSGITIELFNDTNGDGQPDGSAIATKQTNTDGNYVFTNLQPGDYVAVETQPANLVNVSENEGGSDNDKPDNTTINAIAGRVTAGETDTHNDFIEEEQLGSWTGNVMEDTNHDGIGDQNLSGVEIKLYKDTNRDGQPDGAAIATTQTDNDGNYVFTNLQPGDYVAVETQPDNLLNVSENEGGADNDQAGTTAINAIAGTVDPGETDTNNDFIEESPVVSLGSVVWNDVNDNGIQDTDESGIANAVVTLLDHLGKPVDGVAPQTTQADGTYFFEGLPEGSYKVQVTVSAVFALSSVQNTNANDDKENDSNINTSEGNVHTSGLIILTNNGEPEETGTQAGDEADEDNNNGNMTVDFGFKPLKATVKLLKTLYGNDDPNTGHDNGAGCGTARATSETILVDLDKSKDMPVTYCFK